MSDASTVQAEVAQILITVKTYPTPSERHMETVCVAGVRIDTVWPEWIRLYPIPFRTRFFDYQFSKYQKITVPITSRGSTDPRPESYRPDIQNIDLGEKVDSRNNWSRRATLLGHLVGERTTCELIRINRETPMNMPAPSLGLIKPVDIVLSVDEGVPWTDSQRAKVERAVTPDLFSVGAVKTELEPAPYQIRARYRCLERTCGGHRQTIIDWEVGAAARAWSRSYPAAELPDRLLSKWSEMIGPEKDLHLYIGNQHQHRQTFSILGTWYPSSVR